MVKSDLALGGLDAFLDAPADTRDADQGTSRQAVLVRNSQMIPLGTVRSSSRFLPRSDRGNRGGTNSHSESDSSWRQITQP